MAKDQVVLQGMLTRLRLEQVDYHTLFQGDLSPLETIKAFLEE